MYTHAYTRTRACMSVRVRGRHLAIAAVAVAAGVAQGKYELLNCPAERLSAGRADATPTGIGGVGRAEETPTGIGGVGRAEETPPIAATDSCAIAPDMVEIV